MNREELEAKFRKFEGAAQPLVDRVVGGWHRAIAWLLESDYAALIVWLCLIAIAVILWNLR